MLIVPKSRPILENLNTYYVDVKKLIEHFQGAIGNGAIFFSSGSERAVLYFDQESIINAISETKEGIKYGKSVIDSLLESASKANYRIDIYYIDPSKIYFFAYLTNSELIYKGLSSEFTDLSGLIKKISAEKLTGYIEVLIDENRESAYLLFDRGRMIGGSYSWAKNDVNNSKENFEELLFKVRERQAVFNVAKVVLSEGSDRTKRILIDMPTPTKETSPIGIAEKLLQGVEQIFMKEAKKGSFSIILRRKFIEKAETYPFLDPFAGEFEYSEGRIRYEGETSGEEVLKALIQCINEIVTEQNLGKFYSVLLSDLKSKYTQDLRRLNITL